MRRWAVGVLGIWRRGGGELGDGWSKWGQFTSNLRPRWTIPLTAGGCQVCQVSRKGYKEGDKGELAKGRKTKGNAPCIYVIVLCT